MDHIPSTRSTANKSIYGLAVRWFFMAAIGGCSSIVLHELAHYLTAIVSGASDVSFHWAYVDHDSSSVSNTANAFIALLGPLSSYLMALAAWLYVRRTPSSFALALGFAAAFRNLAVLPYTVKMLLGQDTSTFFFDEIRGASAMGISPLYFVIPSLIVGIVGTLYFGRQAQRGEGTILTVAVIVGGFAGIYFWSIFGAMLFPGGHGFN